MSELRRSEYVASLRAAGPNWTWRGDSYPYASLNLCNLIVFYRTVLEAYAGVVCYPQ